MALKAGDQAPAFRLEDQDGVTHALDELHGKKVLLYFYPKDDTHGCTLEAQQFNQLLERFESEGIVVLGVSKDDARSHQRFRAKYGLRFPLLCDLDASVAQAYGAYGEKHMYGRTTQGVNRSTFLIDGDGRIERAWYNVRADGHPEAVLTTVAP